MGDLRNRLERPPKVAVRLSRQAALAIVIVAIAGACTASSKDKDYATFPPEPATCAGPEQSGYQRAALWKAVADGEGIRIVDVSLANTMSPNEVSELVPDGLSVTHVLVVTPEAQGTYAKAFGAVEPGVDLAETATSIARRSRFHDPNAGADTAALDRADVPIGGLRVEGDHDAFAGWLRSQRCDVWSIAPVTEAGTYPRPSPAVDPS